MSYSTGNVGLPSSVRPGRSNTINHNVSQSHRSKSAGSSRSASVRYGMMMDSNSMPPPVPTITREVSSRNLRGPASDSGRVMYRAPAPATNQYSASPSSYNVSDRSESRSRPVAVSRSPSRDPGRRYGRQDLRDTASEGGDLQNVHRSTSQHHLRQTQSRPASPEVRPSRGQAGPSHSMSPRPTVQRSKSQLRGEPRDRPGLAPMFSKDPSAKYPPVVKPKRSGSPVSQRSTGSSSSFNDSLFDKRSGTSSAATSIRSAESKEALRQPKINAPWANHGYYDAARSLWDSVTTKLTDLSKTWREEDENAVPPPGQDSHLSLVMKRFYLERVESAQDLPDWLFTDRERHIGDGTQDFVIKDLDAEWEAKQKQKQETRSRADNTYLSTTQRQEQAWRDRRKYQYDDDPSPTLSRATTRLRAMADAKRGGQRYM